MNITVMTDASWCPVTRCAGYGYWIASQRGKKPGSGFIPIEQELNNPCEAEMLGVVNAIHKGCYKHFLIHKGDVVLIQLDSMAAILAFTGKRVVKTENEQTAIAQLAVLSEQFKLDLYFKHVKGHTQNEDARSKSNNYCDNAAKAALKQARQLKGNKMVKPMLAVDAKGDINFPVYASPKLDGIRAIIKDGQVLSRSLKPIPNQYIQHILGSNPLLDGLDGELIVGEANHFNAMQNTSSGVMTRTGKPDFTFYVFDFYTKPDMPYKERYEMLSNPVNLQHLEKQGSRVKLLKQTLIRNMRELEVFEAYCLKEGYEGVMVRSVDSRYKYGRSTHKEQYLLKVKRFTDSEATIVDVQELHHNHNEAQIGELGQTKRSTCKDNLVPGNTLGALVVTTEEGVTFNIGTGFTATKRDELWQMHKRGELVGKLAKYKHFEVGSKEAPRFPVFIGLRDPIDL